MAGVGRLERLALHDDVARRLKPIRQRVWNTAPPVSELRRTAAALRCSRRSEARKGKRDTSSPGGGRTQVDGVPRAGGVGVADRALVPHAVDQVVRHDSPAHRPVPIGGVDRRGVESLQNHIVDDVPSDQVVVALSTHISLAQDLEKKATQTPAMGEWRRTLQSTAWCGPWLISLLRAVTPTPVSARPGWYDQHVREKSVTVELSRTWPAWASCVRG